MSYKHGVYGTVAETYEAQSKAMGTIPVYIGSAPIHRIGSDYANYVNRPFLVSSLREVKELGLYSEDWTTYTLSEAIHAHFMNGDSAVAPIMLVNVLDPSTNIAAEATKASVTMKKVGKKFVGYIEDPLCCIDNIAITVETGTGATPANTTYHYDGDTVVIESDFTFISGKEDTASLIAEATYKRIDFTAEDFTETAFDNAIASLDYCEQITGAIPNIIAAPSLSIRPELYSIMVAKAMEKIAGKWNCIVLADIPNNNETYDEAQTFRSENAYDSKYSKVFWPSLAHGDKVYHGSTIGAYMMQKIDTENDDVPYVSVSNKPIFCDRAVISGADTLMISEQKANELNAAGITTVNFVKGGLRLWGAHMANYDHSKIGSIAPEDRFDVSARMQGYILNYLQNQYINEIDESFTRKDVDAIVNSAQTWLDSLVNAGMLLYASISFNDESNSDTDIANGDFVFDLQVTYTVTGKSITFKLQYTSAGISVLTTSGGEA